MLNTYVLALLYNLNLSDPLHSVHKRIQTVHKKYKFLHVSAAGCLPQGDTEQGSTIFVMNCLLVDIFIAKKSLRKYISYELKTANCCVHNKMRFLYTFLFSHSFPLNLTPNSKYLNNMSHLCVLHNRI